MIAAKITEAVRAVCPIHGVSIGRKDDKATWRIDFKDEATPKQRADAKAVLDAFDVAAHDAEQAKAAHNSPILAQIEVLEARQRRPIREHILGYGPGPDGKLPAQRAKDIDDAIKALRAQLRA